MGSLRQILRLQLAFFYRQPPPLSSTVSIFKIQDVVRLNSPYSTHQSKSPSNEFEDLDKPIRYTTSKASAWKAEHTHSGALHPDVPDYQPYVVSFSVAMFLLWFLVLREENDVDEEISKPLWEKVPGLEKTQITLLLKRKQDHNINTEDLLRRLEEIEKEEREMKKLSK